MLCPNCGDLISEDDTLCSNCGASLVASETPTEETPVNKAIEAVPPRMNTMPKQRSSIALAAFSFGIISVLFFISIIYINGFFGIFSGILSILAIILGAVGVNRIGHNPNLKGKGFAIAGLVLGSIMVASWILVIVVTILYLRS